MNGAKTYSFGEWVKQRRTRLHLTQQQLARSVHCSTAMIKKIEADERRPAPELAQLLAVALQLPGEQHAIFIAIARGEQPLDTLADDRDAASTSALQAPFSLPVPATPFVGRSGELARVGDLLQQSECRLLTLIGPGGVGKTRLALAIAEAVQAAFSDGVVFISLAALNDTMLLPNAIARSLRLVLTGPASDQVLAYLRQRHLLLVLDNCEQFDGTLHWLSDLLAQSPGVKLLATSRERLHLAEEWVYVVPALAEAEALFIKTARRVRHDFDADAEQSAVTRICALVENLPLAVELAASWTPLMACGDIAEHIQHDLGLLTADVQNVPERHRSVHAVFDHSWNLLSVDEQTALARLSVFRGGWQAEQAFDVAGATLPLLRRLVDKSLVRVGVHGRYELHELIRQYGARQLTGLGFVDETRTRHLQAVLALITELDTLQFTPQSLMIVARFDREIDNVRAALDWSLRSGNAEAGLQLLNHLWFYWSRRGYFAESVEWGERVIEQADQHDRPQLCIAMSLFAVSLFLQGRYAQAEPMAVNAVAMARRLEDPEALVMALGTYTFYSATLEQALAGLHEGIAIAQEAGVAKIMLPMLYLGAATWYHSSGRSTEAEAYYHQAIDLFRQLHVFDFIAQPLGRLGALALQDGRVREAHALVTQSLAAAQSYGYGTVYLAWGQARLGLVQLYLDEPEAARNNLEQALAAVTDGQDLRTQQEVLAFLSEVMLANGDIETAATHLQASLAICQSLFQQLTATQKLEGSPSALPIDLVALCPRAALLAGAQQDDRRAVTLGSISDALSNTGGQPILPPLRARLDDAMTQARTRLGDATFDACWAQGQSMSLAEAFGYLLAREVP